MSNKQARVERRAKKRAERRAKKQPPIIQLPAATIKIKNEGEK